VYDFALLCALRNVARGSTPRTRPQAASSVEAGGEFRDLASLASRRDLITVLRDPPVFARCATPAASERVPGIADPRVLRRRIRPHE
jgi:hypothetical protein